MKKLFMLVLIITFVFVIVIVDTKSKNEDILKIEITQFLPTGKRIEVPKRKYSEILALVDALGTPYETKFSNFHEDLILGTSAFLKIHKKNVDEEFSITSNLVSKRIRDKDGNIIAVERYKIDREFLNSIRGYVK